MKALKKIKSIASTLMTIASVLVLILALGAVDIKEWSWIAFAVYFGALAWIVFAIQNACNKGA